MNPFAFLTASVLVASAMYADASLIYRFEQSGTGEVLATLELASLPTSDLGDVVDFRFTPAGDAIYALGTGPLGGLLGFFGGSANDDGANGLSGPGVLSIDTPPTPSDLTNYPGFTVSNTFRAEFAPPGTSDAIDYRYNDGQLRVSGDWVLVPEPASFALLCLGGLLVLRRRCQP